MIKTIDIEIAIMQSFDIRRNLIVPGITDSSNLNPIRFEIDMLLLTKSNLAHAFEINVSKNDLKNDLKKYHIKSLDKNPKYFDLYYGKLKHFSYAVPLDLKEEALNQIPNFCGLWVVDENEYPRRNSFYCVREPKKLSNYKFTEKERLEVARLGAMRILGLKQKIRSLEKQQ